MLRPQLNLNPLLLLRELLPSHKQLLSASQGCLQRIQSRHLLLPSPVWSAAPVMLCLTQCPAQLIYMRCLLCCTGGLRPATSSCSAPARAVYGQPVLDLTRPCLYAVWQLRCPAWPQSSTQCAATPCCAGSVRPATSSCSAIVRATCSTSGPGTGQPLPPGGTGRRDAARLWQTSWACSRLVVRHGLGIVQPAGQRQAGCRGQLWLLQCFPLPAPCTLDIQARARLGVWHTRP